MTDEKEKIVLWLIAFFGIVITSGLVYNIGWTHCNDENKRPIYNIVETMKWDSIQKHEQGYIYSLKAHEKISLLVDEIVKNEKLKRLYCTFNDSTLTRFVDSLKEVKEAIIYYQASKEIKYKYTCQLCRHGTYHYWECCFCNKQICEDCIKKYSYPRPVSDCTYCKHCG